MMFEGFDEEDFALFNLDGFEARMTAIKTTLWPKLEALGKRFESELSEMTGEDIYAHVARHARRTVNPPPETWVAFSPSERGYKKYGHLAVGIHDQGVWTRFVLKPEAEAKPIFARILSNGELASALPETETSCWRGVAKMSGRGTVDQFQSELDTDQIEATAERLQSVKSAELSIGFDVDRAEAALYDKAAAERLLQQRLTWLLPFYLQTKDAMDSL